jgi:hypothetical protein
MSYQSHLSYMTYVPNLSYKVDLSNLSYKIDSPESLLSSFLTSLLTNEAELLRSSLSERRFREGPVNKKVRIG